MSILARKEKEGFVFTGIARLAISGFIVSLASAYVTTIWALYLDSFFNNIVYVGFFSAGLTLVAFLSYFFIIPVIERNNKVKIYSLSLLLYGIAYALFAINTNLYIFILIAFAVTILAAFRVTSFGIIVKDKSSKKNLSRNEGLMYTCMNTAWVIGPLIAGLVSEKFGINMVFALSAIFIFLAYVNFKTSGIRDANIKKKTDDNAFKNFLCFFSNKNRVLAYVLGGGVNFWWSLIYLFIPLLIVRSGLHKVWVGYFLFAIPIPLISLQYFFSKLAGRTGFKKIFKVGFLIPGVLAIFCFFVTNIYAILSLLVLASVGLAMLEATTEAYFFDISKKKEELRFYAPYNTTIDANHFVARILASTLLIFLPFRFIFLLYGAFMLLFSFLSSRIKDVVELKKK